MHEFAQTSDLQDICLLLRAYGEQRWLSSELLPVLRELEQPGTIPEDQHGAALAYLEVLWLDARHRAAETERAHADIHPGDPRRDPILHERAERYHAAVRRLRSALAVRVNRCTQPQGDGVEPQHAGR